MTDLKRFIRTIPDFPKPGIQFRDVTTLFSHPQGFKLCIDQLAAPFTTNNLNAVVGLEARGFVIGGAVADRLNVGFVPIRKAGKLPGNTLSQDFELEYGNATFEIHDDALSPGARVLLIDDLLATGGSAIAALNLLEKLGAEVVSCAFVVDLPALGGRERLREMGIPVTALCTFDGD